MRGTFHAIIERNEKSINMMKSMTGFGRSEVQDEQYRFTVEMKSVNHRYLDFNFKIPKKLSLFESAVRSVLKEYMQRGKVDVFITYENYTQSRISLKYNRDIARQYLDYLQEMERDFSIENDITVSGLSRYPEVLPWKNSRLMRKNSGEFWNRHSEMPQKHSPLPGKRGSRS